MMRVARVRGGVIVRKPHRDGSAARQRDRVRVAVDILPAEVPVVDVDERASAAVGQCGGCTHSAPEVVRVWLNREHVHVHRQPVAVGDGIRPVSRFDVDRLAAQADSDRRFRRDLIREKQPDAHLDWFRFAGRLHVELDDDVAARIEPPGRVVR
jgi:hypothetical protein